MQFSDAIEILQHHEADLKRIGVKSLYMFGSTVKGNQREDSDVDMFFEYDKETLGILELLKIERTASEYLGCKADVTTKDGLHPRLNGDIKSSSRKVF